MSVGWQQIQVVRERSISFQTLEAMNNTSNLTVKREIDLDISLCLLLGLRMGCSRFATFGEFMEGTVDD